MHGQPIIKISNVMLVAISSELVTFKNLL